MLLQPNEHDLQMLFIHRAHHPQDPWSGHMAFPGGRQDPEDADLRVTIQRETKEEVGIDLDLHGEYLGQMTALQAMARGRPISMIVAPFVYLLQQADVEKIVSRPMPDGTSLTVPALVYGGKTIWGLTYRMLQGFLELIDGT
jgi:8-oxo-dGTP pyrophosphatase MutT (NUDIX family)